MAAHSVSYRYFQVTLWTLKSWMVIYLYMLWTSCCFNTSVSGQNQVIGSSQAVLAKVGDEAILPCHIEPPVNMERRLVEWLRPDLKPQFVLILRNGLYLPEQNPLYKERTSLFHTELSHGNISLKLSRVKLSDEGTYQCKVPDLKRSSNIQLLVGAVSQPVISSIRPKDGGLSLTCDSGCWFPEPEMSWLDGDENNITAEPSVTLRPSPHCYNVQRNVTVTRAGLITCRVHLPHIKHDVDSHQHILERNIPRDGGSTGGRGRKVIVIPVIISIMVAAVLLYLYWNQTITTLRGEEKARQDKASKLRGLLVKTSGYYHITYYEGQLQDNMDNTYLSVKLGTEPKIKFENIYIKLFNVDINVTDIHSHHEVRQMEMKKAGEEIQLSEIFKDSSEKEKKRTVLTVGCAGIGKTFLVHKFVFDWAKQRFPQDPHLIFPFKFRQLNLLKGQKFSLAKLIHTCIKETRFIEEDILNDIFTILQKSGNYNKSPIKVLFVMDGYDENKFQLDFATGSLIDIYKSYPVEILLVNLIQGELLPSAHIWITSRPAAAKQIPKEFVNRMTEVRGFIRDEQKENFFKQTISDKTLVNKIYSHIKKSKILYIMCEIPVFCRITAIVLKKMGVTVELPKTLTELYSHFLIAETQRENMNNPAVDETDKEKLIECEGNVLLKLGRLAFEQLDKGDIMFYEKDLEECGLDVKKDMLCSDFCTTFFKEDDVFFLHTVYCFVHLSIQEFLAAVYLFHCFTQRNMEVLKTFLKDDDYNNDSSLSDFLKAAMGKTLQSESGHLDLFARFLHGLSLESNQSLLGGLLGQKENSPEEIQRAINNLKEMDASDSPDRCINIFHCLMEMNDPSLSQGIEQYLESENRSEKKLSETQCSALATMLQMSEKVLEVLDLDKYNTDKWGRHRLIPAVRNCTTARLVGCGLQKEHIEVVASALSSNPSHLRHLDLSSNYRLDLDLLCDALKNPHCRLETLRLMNCWLSERSCEALASAIRSNPSHLRELDLKFNVLPESLLMNFSGLETLNVKHGGHEHWTNPQLLKRYLHPLTLDPNTANRKLCLSEDNRKVTTGEELQLYPDHPDRFDDVLQVLCTEGLTGRCYWEVEWSGWVGIGVTYRGISRRGDGSELGCNDKSWCLFCYGDGYYVIHNSRHTDLPVRPSGSNRVSVYLDCPAGTVSFYQGSSDSLTHLYSFQSSFTEPLYPGFMLSSYSSFSSSSVCLCEDR